MLTLTLKDLLLLGRDKTALFWVIVFPLAFGLIYGARMRVTSVILAVYRAENDSSRSAVARVSRAPVTSTNGTSLRPKT